MPDPNHAYVLSDAPADRELERLRDIDEFMGPTTQRRIAQLGITRGWRCLEVGAGAGGVARWMARQVGPSGKVTAIDLAPRFAEDPELPQLEVRRHDILQEGLDAGSYDLAHCRVLLTNVGNAELALRRMADTLRPGGWLIVEEPGESRFPAVGESDSRVAEFNRLAGHFLATVQERVSAVELTLFRRLPSMFQTLGLAGVGGELTHLLVDAPGRAALLGTVQALRPLLAGTPFVTEGQVERLVELCADPALLTMGGSTLCLWGQRTA
jgi:SAM-dependent methyltransferase